MAGKIQLKFHPSKKLHEELENHHKMLEGIRKDAENVLKTYKTQKTPPRYDFNPQDVLRVHTGVEGFDELIEGGIPQKSIILLTGTTGTGKSIFSMEFLIEGAMNNEHGVYVSLQESMEETINQMRFFGWPIDKLIEEGKIVIIQPELYNFDALLTSIEDAIDKVHAKRLVIDSISIIGMYFEEPFKIRKSLLELNQMLKKLGCTTLAISEVGEGKVELSPYGVEEYVSDGVVILYFIKKGNMFLRAITIRKLRSTNHSTKIHPIEIRRPGGVIIYPSEEIFVTI